MSILSEEVLNKVKDLVIRGVELSEPLYYRDLRQELTCEITSRDKGSLVLSSPFGRWFDGSCTILFFLLCLLSNLCWLLRIGCCGCRGSCKSGSHELVQLLMMGVSKSWFLAIPDDSLVLTFLSNGLFNCHLLRLPAKSEFAFDLFMSSCGALSIPRVRFDFRDGHALLWISSNQSGK